MAITKLACPACGIGVPVDGPVAPQSNVTCPECHKVFPAREGMPPAPRTSGGSSGGGGVAIVVVILCLVLGLGAVVVIGAVVAVGMAFFLAANDGGKPAGNNPAVAGAPLPDVNQPPDEGPKVGEPAPEIEGEDIDGKPMKLSDYRGKVVVLDFWGHW
jgi:hypothetical protein